MFAADHGLAAHGAVSEEVAGAMAQGARRAGFDEVILYFNVGLKPHAMVKDQMQRFMEQIAPAGPVYQAGTLSGNPLAMAAGLATLALLREQDAYDRLEATSSAASGRPSYISSSRRRMFASSALTVARVASTSSGTLRMSSMAPAPPVAKAASAT